MTAHESLQLQAQMAAAQIRLAAVRGKDAATVHAVSVAKAKALIAGGGR